MDVLPEVHAEIFHLAKSDPALGGFIPTLKDTVSESANESHAQFQTKPIKPTYPTLRNRYYEIVELYADLSLHSSWAEELRSS